MDTYEAGVAWVIIIVFAALFFISSLDAACELFRLPSIGYRVNRWSAANGWYAGALILLVAVLLAHFLLNPLPCLVPPASPGAAPLPCPTP